MVRLVFVLAIAAIVAVCLVGCGGGGGDSARRFSVRVDFVSVSATRPQLALALEERDGSFTTMSHVPMEAGSNRVYQLPEPWVPGYPHWVIAYNDIDRNNEYTDDGRELLGYWNGYLTFENDLWAGRRLSNDSLLFRDVTSAPALNIFVDYVRATATVSGTPMTLRQVIDAAKVKK